MRIIPCSTLLLVLFYGAISTMPIGLAQNQSFRQQVLDRLKGNWVLVIDKSVQDSFADKKQTPPFAEMNIAASPQASPALRFRLAVTRARDLPRLNRAMPAGAPPGADRNNPDRLIEGRVEVQGTNVVFLTDRIDQAPLPAAAATKAQRFFLSADYALLLAGDGLTRYARPASTHP